MRLPRFGLDLSIFFSSYLTIDFFTHLTLTLHQSTILYDVDYYRNPSSYPSTDGGAFVLSATTPPLSVSTRTSLDALFGNFVLLDAQGLVRLQPRFKINPSPFLFSAVSPARTISASSKYLATNSCSPNIRPPSAISHPVTPDVPLRSRHHLTISLIFPVLLCIASQSHSRRHRSLCKSHLHARHRAHCTSIVMFWQIK